MAARNRWLIAVAGAVCLHAPWWPRVPGGPTPPVGVPGVPPPMAFTIRHTPPAAPAAMSPAAAAVGRQAASHRANTPSTGPTPDVAAALEAFAPPEAFHLEVLWTQGGREQPMHLDWRIDGRSYRLTLRTPPGLPRQAAHWLSSEGTWGETGLQPVRHTVKRPGRSEIAVSLLDIEGRRQAAFSATTFTVPVDATVQDSLSWLVGWFGPAAQRGAPPRRLQIVLPEGRIVDLRFEPDANDPLHWRGTPAGPEEDLIEVWLSASFPHLPQRWRQTAPWSAPSEWRLAHQNDAPTGKPPLESAERAPITPVENASGTPSP